MRTTRAVRLVLTLAFAFGLLAGGIFACGTTGPGAPLSRQERGRTSAPLVQAPAPANAPEMDGANRERRFGLAEARRREAEARLREREQRKRVDVTPPAQ